MFKRQSLLAAAAALLLGCGVDLYLDNPSPPGTAPGATGAAGDTGVGGSASAPGATPGDTATPPGATAPGAPAAGAPAAGPPAAGPPAAGPPAAGAPAAASAVTHTVTVLNMQYSQATTTVRVGDTVTWENIDSMDHTATSDTGAFGGLLAQGASYSFTFASAGTFPYHCEKHKTTMKGTVVVQP